MKPISRRELIRRLRKYFSFKGPFSGGKHPFMVRGDFKLPIPNLHKSKDIGPELLLDILEQAGISKEEWDKLD